MSSKEKKKNPPTVFEAFNSFDPFHGIIHYYVDLNCFLIGPSLPSLWRSLNRRIRTSSLFELEKKYGDLSAKGKYLDACVARSKKDGKSVCGSFLGFRDLLVPILKKEEVLGFLVAGAFADHELTEGDVKNCWRELAKREPSINSSEFLEFTRILLDIPVLDEPLLKAYQETLELFAEILAGEKELKPIHARMNYLLKNVIPKKMPHSFFMAWALGQPTSESVPTWSREIEEWEWIREEIGISRVPTTVIAVIPRSTSVPLDPLAEALRIYRFQRHCFHFSKTLRETLGGKLENYGAVFLTSADPSLSRLQRRKQIQETAEKIHRFAVKELGGPALVGIGETVPRGETLGESFRQAVLALHLGRKTGKPIVFFKPGPSEGEGGVLELERLLLELKEQFETASYSGFEVILDGYLKQVLVLSFQDPEEIRWHLQYGLLQVLEAAKNRFDLGEKDAKVLRETMAMNLEKAGTTHEMVLAFKESLHKVRSTGHGGNNVRSVLSIESVREYLGHHYREPLDMGKLAKLSGLSISTLSRRFKKTNGMGLETHLRQLRLGEGKELLKNGDLPVSKIALHCGFRSASHFSRLFKEKMNQSPQDYRRSSRSGS
jgi:AraC-like DNA-binding protein